MSAKEIDALLRKMSASDSGASPEDMEELRRIVEQSPAPETAGPAPSVPPQPIKSKDLSPNVAAAGTDNIEERFKLPIPANLNPLPQVQPKSDNVSNDIDLNNPDKRIQVSSEEVDPGVPDTGTTSSPFVIPETIEQDFAKAKNKINTNLKNYTINSEFNIGPAVDQVLTQTEQHYTSAFQKKGFFEQAAKQSGRDLTQQLINGAWYALAQDPEELEKARNIFIGLATEEIESLNRDEATFFVRSRLGSEEGEAEIFAALYDYVVSTPSASDNLKAFYTQTGLLDYKKTISEPDDLRGVSPNLTANYPEFADKLAEDFNKGDNFISAMSRWVTDEDINLASIPFYRLETILEADTFLREHYSTEAEREARQVEQAREDMIQRLPTDEEYVLHTLTAHEIGLIYMMPQFNDIPIHTFVEAMLVKPNELERTRWGGGTSARTADASDQWTHLGLTPDQQQQLLYVLKEGVRPGVSNQVIRAATEATKKAEWEQSVLKWRDNYIAEQALIRGDVDYILSEPIDLSTEQPSLLDSPFVSNGFLMANGFKAVDDHNFFQKVGKGIFDASSDIVGGILALDELYIDGSAENTFRSPFTPIVGTFEHDPYERAGGFGIGTGYTYGKYSVTGDLEDGLTEQFMWALGELNKGGTLGGRRYSPEQILFLSRVFSMTVGETLDGAQKGAWSFLGGSYDLLLNIAQKSVYKATQTIGTSMGFLNDEDMRELSRVSEKALTTLDSEQLTYTVESMLNKLPGYKSWLDEFPELEGQSPFESYKGLRSKMLHPDSGPGGLHRKNLFRIYTYHATPQERKEMEDAIGGFFEYDMIQDPSSPYDRRFELSNMRLFNDLVLEQGVPIGEAMSEAFSIGQIVRAGFSYGTFNLLEFGLGSLIARGIGSTFKAAKGLPSMSLVGQNTGQLLKSLVKGEITSPSSSQLDQIYDEALVYSNQLDSALSGKIDEAGKPLLTRKEVEDTASPAQYERAGGQIGVPDTVQIIPKKPMSLKEKMEIARPRAQEILKSITDPAEVKKVEAATGGRTLKYAIDQQKYYERVRDSLDPELSRDAIARLTILLDEIKEGRLVREIPAGKIIPVAEGQLGFFARAKNNFFGKYSVHPDALPTSIKDLVKEKEALDEFRKILDDIRTETQRLAQPPDMPINVAGRFDGIANDLGSAITRAGTYVDESYSLKQYFKINKALVAANELADLDVANWKAGAGRFGYDYARTGAEIVESPTFHRGKEVRNLFSFGNKDPQKLVEGSLRDFAARNVTTTMSELHNILSAFGPRFDETLPFDRPAVIKDIMMGLKKVGKEDNPIEYLMWLQTKHISDVMYADQARALDILKDLDFLNMPSLGEKGMFTLKSGVKEADAKIDDWDVISFPEWWSKFNRDVQEAATTAILKRYGLDEDTGQFLKVQNAINGALSRLYLERPSFAARNWTTNKALGLLDGMSISDWMRNRDALYKEIWGDVEFASKGFTARSIGTDLSYAIPIRGESKWVKVAFGGANETVQRGGWKGVVRWLQGGSYIPFVGGGLPGFFARELSGYAESVDRMRIIDKAATRWYRHITNEQSITQWFRENNPEAMEQFKKSGMWSDLLAAGMSPGTHGIDKLIRVVQTVSEDGSPRTFLETYKPLKELLTDLEVHGPHAIDNNLEDLFDRLKDSEIIFRTSARDPQTGQSYLDPAYGLKAAIQHEIYKHEEKGRAIAAMAGFTLDPNASPHALRKRSKVIMPFGRERIRDQEEVEELTKESEVFTRLFNIYDEAFETAKNQLRGPEGGTLGEREIKIAHDTAMEVTRELSKPIRALEEFTTDLVDLVSSPEAYKSAKYGYVKKLLMRKSEKASLTKDQQDELKLLTEPVLGYLPNKANIEWLRTLDENSSFYALDVMERLIMDATSQIKDGSPLNIPIGTELDLLKVPPDVREAAETARRIIYNIRKDSILAGRTLVYPDQIKPKQEVWDRLNKRLYPRKGTLTDAKKQEILNETILDIMLRNTRSVNLTAGYIRRHWLSPNQKKIFTNADVERALQRIIDDGTGRQSVWDAKDIDKRPLEVVPNVYWDRRPLPESEKFMRPTAFSPKYDDWRPMSTPKLRQEIDELAEALDILADRATMLAMSRQDLKDDVIKFADELLNGSQEVMDETITIITRTLQDVKRTSNQYGPSISPKELNKVRQNIIEAVTERLQGVGNTSAEGIFTPSFIQKYGEAFNELARRVGVPDLERTLDLRKGGSHQADRVGGLDTWHDQGQHEFEHWLLTNAPIVSFLRRWDDRLTQEIAQGAPTDSSAQRFINAIDEVELAQGRLYSGARVDAELDEPILRAIKAELDQDALFDNMDWTVRAAMWKERRDPELSVVTDAARERAGSQEYLPEHQRFYPGVRRRATLDDIREYSFLTSTEEQVTLEKWVRNIEGFDNLSKAEQEELLDEAATRSLSIPIRRMAGQAAGETADPSKAAIQGPAARGWADGKMRVQQQRQAIQDQFEVEEQALRESIQKPANKQYKQDIKNDVPVKVAEAKRDKQLREYGSRHRRLEQVRDENLANIEPIWILKGPKGVRDLKFYGDEKVLPANIFMPPHKQKFGEQKVLEDLPPQGLHGRVFLQNAPVDPDDGRPFQAWISNDTFKYENENRLGVFISQSATPDEIKEGIARIAKFNNQMDTGPIRKRVADEFKMPSRGDHNWSGYRASWAGSSGSKFNDPRVAQMELAKIIKEIDDLQDPSSALSRSVAKGVSKGAAEAERGIERRARINLASYMLDQWEKGFPIYGRTNGTADELLPVFKNEQKIFEQERVLARESRAGRRTEIPLDENGGTSIVDNVIDALHSFQAFTNNMRRVSSKLGAAQADWILHDYNNTSNVDYILRWLGPWHIWQTRTTGKLALSLADAPHLLNRFSQYIQTVQGINRDNDVSQYYQRDLPIGFLMQPFFGASKAIGKEDSAWMQTAKHYQPDATLNINAFLFANDMFDYFPSSGRPSPADADPMYEWSNDYTAGGKALDIYKRVGLPISPGIDLAAAAMGWYGEDAQQDLTQRGLGSAIRSGNVTMATQATLSKKNSKTSIIRTGREIRDIDRKFLDTMFALAEKDPNPMTNESLFTTMTAYDLWSRIKYDNVVNVPLLHGMFGNFFGTDMQTLLQGLPDELRGPVVDGVPTYISPINGKQVNGQAIIDTVSTVMREAVTRRTIRDLGSIGPGFALNVPDDTRILNEETGRYETASDILTMFYDLVKNRTTTSKEYEKFFTDHPYIRTYQANKKYDTQPILNAQASNMEYALREKLDLKYNAKLNELGPDIPRRLDIRADNIDEKAGIVDYPASNEETETVRAKIKEERRLELMGERYKIWLATGVNTGVRDGKVDISRAVEGKDLPSDAVGEIIDIGPVSPNHTIDKRSFGDSKFLRELIHENIVPIEKPIVIDVWNEELEQYERTEYPLLFAETMDYAGAQKVIDVLDKLFPDGHYKEVKKEDIEDFLDGIVEDYNTRYGYTGDSRYKKEWVDVDMFNATTIASAVQAVKINRHRAAPTMFSDEFKEQYRIVTEGASAGIYDWNKYFQDREDFYNNLKQKDPQLHELFMIYEARTYSVDDAVEKIFEELYFTKTREEIAGVYDRDIIVDPKALANHAKTIGDMSPIVTEAAIREQLEKSHFGSMWMAHQEISDSDLTNAIRGVLKSAENITFSDSKEGKIEAKFWRLRSQINEGVPEDSLSVFASPNGTPINLDNIEEFAEAMAVYELLKTMPDIDVSLKLAAATDNSHRAYYKFFMGRSPQDANRLIAIIDSVKAYNDAGQYEEANELYMGAMEQFDNGMPWGQIQALRKGIPEAGTVGAGDDQEGYPPKITSGFPSSGKKSTNINRKYNVFDLGRNPALSSEAKNIKAVLTSKYYENKQLVPGDFFWETLARNGVVTRDDIIDMWETLYPALVNLYKDLPRITSIRSLLSVVGQSGIFSDSENNRTATYQYIDALASLVGLVTGIQLNEVAPVKTVRPTAPWQKPASQSKYAEPTTTGAGGLPQWDEVTRHIRMVFHDDELETSLIGYFMYGKKLTKNHERMLRAMFRTFPIGTGYTFEKWIQALKLIYQTKALLGMPTGRQDLGRNPLFRYPTRPPRMAKYRE